MVWSGGGIETLRNKKSIPSSIFFNEFREKNKALDKQMFDKIFTCYR